MKRNILAQQQGQSVILIALMMVAIVAMLGLAIDGGEVYLARRDAQNASDAAAFAGARRLRANAPTDSAIRAVINQYAQANHVANPATDVAAYYLTANNTQSNCQIGSCGSISGYTGVVVTSTITFNTFFIGILSSNGPIGIPARAKVQTGQLTGPGSPLVPMAVPLPNSCPPDQAWNGNPNCSLQPGVTVTLFGTETGSGNLQWLNLGAVDPDPVSPCNENCIAQYIMQTRTPAEVVIGDWLYSTTGVSVNKCTGGQTPNTSIICALDYWIDKVEAGENVRWIVPIFQMTRNPTGNNLQYQVIAFAAFKPTGYNFGNGKGWSRNFDNKELCINPYTLLEADANTKCIKGVFQQFVVAPGQVNPNVQCNVNAINICGMELKE